MSRYRRIYLNDYLAGATLGAELAKRTAKENPDGELGEVLRWLAEQMTADRASLIRVLREQGGKPSAGKSAGGWVVERLGRLKPNGHVVTYSPLSRLVELDGLARSIDAKRSLWLALQAAGVEGLDDLIARAAEQRERLEPHRLAAARTALSSAAAT
jgi:hypothetical protein